MKLIEFQRNIHSQNGEDGILQKMLDLLRDQLPEEKFCVEFGAWDGRFLSNTFALIEKGWRGVYIEGDPEKHKDLLKTAAQYPGIIALNAMVSFSKNSDENLDRLLAKTEIPDDYELLSIDIDSHDLAVWAAYSGKPKIVVIEINSAIPPGIFQWHNGVEAQGNSFSSTLSVAREKGYTLACHTGNMIFIRDDLLPRLGLAELDISYPERLFRTQWLVQKKPPNLSMAQKLKRFIPASLKKRARKFYNPR